MCRLSMSMTNAAMPQFLQRGRTGGSEELLGVLGGTFRRASSSVTRASKAAICSACASTSAISSALSRVCSESASMSSLEQLVQTRSITPSQSVAPTLSHQGGEQLPKYIQLDQIRLQ